MSDEEQQQEENAPAEVATEQVASEGSAAVSLQPAEVVEEPAQEAAVSEESPVAEVVEEQAPAEVTEEETEEAEEESIGEQLKESDYPWYVVNTYSGFEANAKKNLEEKIRSLGLTERFGNILVPQETVVELVRGQKKTSTRKFFPGYMLIQMDLDEETWHLVKDTPKVTGFVGDPRNPAPLSPAEVSNLVSQMEGGAAAPRPRVQFEEGDAIKVIDGPFTDFNGTVDEVKTDKGKLRVLISIFGRNTPVELDFVQVEKA